MDGNGNVHSVGQLIVILMRLNYLMKQSDVVFLIAQISVN